MEKQDWCSSSTNVRLILFLAACLHVGGRSEVRSCLCCEHAIRIKVNFCAIWQRLLGTSSLNVALPVELNFLAICWLRLSTSVGIWTDTCHCFLLFVFLGLKAHPGYIHPNHLPHQSFSRFEYLSSIYHRHSSSVCLWLNLSEQSYFQTLGDPHCTYNGDRKNMAY